jgi:hypothetical protein
LEIAGWLMSNGAASSVTVAWPDASRARMARRVGSASAARVAAVNLRRLIAMGLNQHSAGWVLT